MLRMETADIFIPPLVTFWGTLVANDAGNCIQVLKAVYTAWYLMYHASSKSGGH